jgi:hypothetical protein
MSGKKEVRFILAILIWLLVHQERRYKSGSSPTDWRPHSGRFLGICQEQARDAQFPTRSTWLGPYRQEVGLRCTIHFGPIRNPRYDQWLYGDKKDQGGAQQASQCEHETWVCLGSC